MIPTIDHWTGQEAAIRRFKVGLEAAWNDGTRLPHMLLVGGPGLGKTELAHLAARELGVKIHDRLSQVVTSMGALNGLLIQAGDKEIIFLDEIHELLAQVQTVLYRAMEGQMLSLQGRNDSTLSVPLKDFTIFGATTDEFRLLSPLRDRFKVILPFVDYDPDSLSTITIHRARSLGIEMGAARDRLHGSGRSLNFSRETIIMGKSGQSKWEFTGFRKFSPGRRDLHPDVC